MSLILFRIAVLYGAAVLGVAIGIAIGCDVRRWWNERERIKELAKREPQRLRLVVGGSHDV